MRARSRVREAERSVLDHTATCEECQAINPGGTDYCAECGTTLEPTAPLPGSEAAARLRHEAQSTLKRAFRTLTFVIYGYRLGSAAYAVATVFAVLALTRPEVPVEDGTLVAGLTSALCVLLWMGSLHLPFHPFGWTLAVALLATAVSAVHFRGPDPYGVAAYAAAAWAVVAWIGIVPSLRFGRLIQHHRDLYILHHASLQTRRALKNRTAHERHERLLAAMRRAARRAWRISTVGAVVFLLLVGVGVREVLARRPAELAPVLERFEAAWSDGDLDAVEALFDERVREVEALRLRGSLRGHGFGESPPALEREAVESEETEARIEYSLGSVPMRTEWLRVDTEWFLAHVELPIPSIEDALERFRFAWSISDLEAVVECFAPEFRGSMRNNLEAAIAKRGWESFPAFRDERRKTDGEKRETITFVLDYGVLKTEWHYREEGAWWMHGIGIPAR